MTAPFFVVNMGQPLSERRARAKPAPGPWRQEAQLDPLEKGRYRARLAQSDADIQAALALRSTVFRAGVPDRDRFDARCQHMLIETREDGLVGCFRLLALQSGAAIGHSYAAGFYDLGRLATYPAPMVELGRFCLRAPVPDADILRLAWGALARFVLANRAGMLFGCASFAGCDARLYAGVFASLRARHLAPRRWAPGMKAAETVDFGAAGPAGDNAPMPPLLRSYLAMGGRVGDHAVVDRDLGTLHVFTGLEIGAMPPARRRMLEALAR